MDNEQVKTIYDSETFKNLLREKKKFLIPATLFFLSFYFMLPLLVGIFPAWMNKPLCPPFTWGWGLAFAQFLMVWLLGAIYYFKAKRFDRTVEKIKIQRGME